MSPSWGGGKSWATIVHWIFMRAHKSLARSISKPSSLPSALVKFHGAEAPSVAMVIASAHPGPVQAKPGPSTPPRLAQLPSDTCVQLSHLCRINQCPVCSRSMPGCFWLLIPAPARASEVGQHRRRSKNVFLHGLFGEGRVAGAQRINEAAVLLARAKRLLDIIEPDPQVWLDGNVKRGDLSYQLRPSGSARRWRHGTRSAALTQSPLPDIAGAPYPVQ